MRDSFVAAGLQHAGCGEGDGDPPPFQLQRGFPGLFLSVSAVFLGLPLFSLHQASADPSLHPSLCLWARIIFLLLPPSAFPEGKKTAGYSSKKRAVDPT